MSITEMQKIDEIFRRMDMYVMVEYFNKGDVDGAHHYFYNLFEYIAGDNVTSEILDVIKIAIDNGIDPHYKEDQLLILSCGKSLTLVKFFLDQCGCDINAQNSAPLRSSIVYNNYDIACYLLENGAVINDAIIKIVHYHGFRYMDKMVEYGIPPETLLKSFLLDSYQGSSFLVMMKYFRKYGIGLDALVNEIISSAN